VGIQAHSQWKKKGGLPCANRVAGQGDVAEDNGGLCLDQKADWQGRIRGTCHQGPKKREKRVRANNATKESTRGKSGGVKKKKICLRPQRVGKIRRSELKEATLGDVSGGGVAKRNGIAWTLGWGVREKKATKKEQ